MQENKIEFSKGIVKQAGYPEVTCKIIKAGVNRKDNISDKPLYVAENINLKEGLYAVTPSISEALGRVERKSLGIMNEQGEPLIPMNNSSIILINDKYVACNKYDSERELKIDPTKFQENINVSQQIKTKIKSLVSNDLQFKCDNFNAKYDLYEISEDNKFNKVFENASYIAVHDDVVYAHTNDVMDDTMEFGDKKIEKDTTQYESLPISTARIIDDEPVVKMPVAAFATVQDKPLDSLEVTNDFTEVKPGAPSLIGEPETNTKEKEEPNTMEIQNENNITSSIVETEKPKEEINKTDETNTKEIEINTAKEIEAPKPEKQIEPSFTLEKSNEKTIFDNNDNKDQQQSSSDLADIAGLVSAVKNRINVSSQKIEEQEEALSSKNKEIEELKQKLESLEKDQIEKEMQIKSLNEQNKEQMDKIEMLTTQNNSLTSKTQKLERTVEEVYTAFSGLIDNQEETVNYFRKVA